MQKRMFVSCAVILLVVSLVGIAMQFVRSALRASEMSLNLHAVLSVQNALQSFVASNHSWPSSWDELANSAGPSQGSMYQLPRDLDEVRSRVVLRFDITPQELSNPRQAKMLASREPRYDYEFRLEPLYRQLEETFAKPK